MENSKRAPSSSVFTASSSVGYLLPSPKPILECHPIWHAIHRVLFTSNIRFGQLAGPNIGQLMGEYKWTAMRVKVTLVGIERKRIYFNNDPAKTFESLNGESISQITAVDSANQLIEYDFQKKFYSGSLLSESDLSYPAAPDTEAEGQSNKKDRHPFLFGHVFLYCSAMLLSCP